MKTNVLMAIAIAVVTSLTASAQTQLTQPYSGRSPRDVRQVTPRPEAFTMPERRQGALSEQQSEELQKIRTEQLKVQTQSQNLIREKRARLEVLQTAERPNMAEINKVIDEIAAIQAQQMKAQAEARQKIRSLLTEEQRTLYDARGANRGSLRTAPDRQVPPVNSRFRESRTERPRR